MPWPTSFEVDKKKVLEQNLNYENPYEDKTLKSYLDFGEYLKNHKSSKPHLPIDKGAIEYYKNKSIEVFERDLKEAFGGTIPEIPGLEEFKDEAQNQGAKQ